MILLLALLVFLPLPLTLVFFVSLRPYQAGRSDLLYALSCASAPLMVVLVYAGLSMVEALNSNAFSRSLGLWVIFLPVVIGIAYTASVMTGCFYLSRFVQGRRSVMLLAALVSSLAIVGLAFFLARDLQQGAL